MDDSLKIKGKELSTSALLSSLSYDMILLQYPFYKQRKDNNC